jgi:opacity protein-like surface antigen
MVLFVALGAVAVSAQKDYHKMEVFGGYTYANYDNVLEVIDNDIDPTISLRGFNAQFTYNVHKYVGVKFDYSLTAQRETFADQNASLEVKYKNNQFFGGVQFKNNKTDGPRWKPFGHIMAGIANQKFNARGTVVTGTPPVVATLNDSPGTNNFAMIFGAGLDVRVHKNIDLRLVQIDYNPVFFGGQNIGTFHLDSVTQNNLRMSFGIVFH